MLWLSNIGFFNDLLLRSSIFVSSCAEYLRGCLDGNFQRDEKYEYRRRSHSLLIVCYLTQYLSHWSSTKGNKSAPTTSARPEDEAREWPERARSWSSEPATLSPSVHPTVLQHLESRFAALPPPTTLFGEHARARRRSARSRALPRLVRPSAIGPVVGDRVRFVLLAQPMWVWFHMLLLATLGADTPLADHGILAMSGTSFTGLGVLGCLLKVSIRVFTRG